MPTKLDRRVGRLERDIPAAEPEPTRPDRVYAYCVAHGWRVPKPRPDETLTEWLSWVPLDTVRRLVDSVPEYFESSSSRQDSRRPRHEVLGLPQSELAHDQEINDRINAET